MWLILCLKCYDVLCFALVDFTRQTINKTTCSRLSMSLCVKKWNRYFVQPETNSPKMSTKLLIYLKRKVSHIPYPSLIVNIFRYVYNRQPWICICMKRLSCKMKICQTIFFLWLLHCEMSHNDKKPKLVRLIKKTARSLIVVEFSFNLSKSHNNRARPSLRLTNRFFLLR